MSSKGKKKGKQKRPRRPPVARPVTKPVEKPVDSLLNVMEDGVEFESLLRIKKVNVDLISELRRAMKDIQEIRKCKPICYLANVVNSNIKAPTSINNDDVLPFSEMISKLPDSTKEIDIILVTGGGLAQQVAEFVDKLRPRFDKVNFILPNKAMSAGTIFAMSGNSILMGPNSYIGPIDPQVPGKNGSYVPAQAILTMIDDIQKRGEAFKKKGQSPPWTDIHLLNQIDPKEIGNAINASAYSIELVKNFLLKYKFADWTTHSFTKKAVTPEDRKKRSQEVAEYLCKHSVWKTHSRSITREEAWTDCKLKIEHFESTRGLERAVRRFWALLNWTFENTSIAKVYLSDEYSILRNDPTIQNPRGR